MVSRTLLRMDNRYPTPKERSDLQAYMATTRARRAALEEMRRNALRATDDLIAGMRRMYPEFAKHRPHGFDKGHRDMVLLTNMAANAMFLGETDSLDDMFLNWYKTILKGVHLTPQFLTDTLALWQDSLERNLSADSYVMLRPVLEHITTTLTDLPVPATDEVGERSPLV